MKKLLGFFIVMFLFANLVSNANEIEIQPTMQSKSNTQDRVWVGSFQLAWNDFIDRVVHNPIRFREGTPLSVYELNKKEFSSDDISSESYYKLVSKVNKKTKKEIEKTLKKKFDVKSDIINSLDLTPSNDKYIIYAILKKDFEFVNEFDKLGKSMFGIDDMAEYFGIDQNSKRELGRGIRVLFYNSPDDFALQIPTKNNEDVYLYRNSANKAFCQIYADMLKKQTLYRGNIEFTINDELKVPFINFFKEQSFDEIASKRVMGTNLVINQALEAISFNMDNKGGRLKSEASLGFTTTSLVPDEEKRRFYYENTFVIFLKEKGKTSPYFALRVNDIKKYQKLK